MKRNGEKVQSKVSRIFSYEGLKRTEIKKAYAGDIISIAGIEGIDLDFDKGGHRYLISIKSGPNWGNDSQIKKMCYQFDTARKRLATSGGKETIICVNGCCYGKSREQSEYKSKGSYYKICCKRWLLYSVIRIKSIKGRLEWCNIRAIQNTCLS